MRGVRWLPASDEAYCIPELTVQRAAFGRLRPVRSWAPTAGKRESMALKVPNEECSQATFVSKEKPPNTPCACASRPYILVSSDTFNSCDRPEPLSKIPT